MLRRRSGFGPRDLFAVVQLPQVLPRLVPVAGDEALRFILLEDMVAARLPELFGGFEVQSSTTFRITRDSDLDVIEQESDDMLRLIEERLRARRRADAVRLEVATGANDKLVQMIVEQEQLRSDSSGTYGDYSEVYRIPGPLDLTGFMT
jgi:polyphosphate kinase